MSIDISEFNNKYHELKCSIYSINKSIYTYKIGAKSVNNEIDSIYLNGVENEKENQERLNFLNSYAKKINYEILWRQSKLCLLKKEMEEFLFDYKTSALVEIGSINTQLVFTKCPDVKFELISRRSALKEIVAIADKNNLNKEELEK